MHRDKTGIFAGVTSRPVTVAMLALAVLVFGIISYRSLALKLMPDITYPSVTVRTEFPGAAPQEVESIVSHPLEQALGILPNLVNITSISRAELSDVILEFAWDADMNRSLQEVREQLDQLFFYDNVERPLILRYDPNLDPILRLGISGEISLFELRRVGKEVIKRRLEKVPGVAAVKIRGGWEDEIRIEISERELAVRSLDIGSVVRRLSAENINLAGGTLKEGNTEYVIRTMNEFRDLEEIRQLLLQNPEGVSVPLGDIAQVYHTHTERKEITAIGGRESVEVEIFKEGDANTVTVSRLVRAAVFEPQGGGRPGPGRRAPVVLAETLQQRGIDIRLLSDQARYIQGSIDSVKQAAILGGLFAVIVLYLFLSNVWTTVLIALAIPLSVIATFVPMNLWQVSLNIMSLGGLALGIGMLVDNAIVVLESIHRCREEGDDFVAGAIRGVREVSGAVTASTLTTIAVFFPIVFVEGVAGQLFQDMSLTIVFSLITSLLVALFVIPMLAARRITPGDEQASDKLRDRFSFLRFSVLTRFRRLHERIKRVSKPGFGRFVHRLWLRSLFPLLLLPASAHLVAWLLLMLVVAVFFAGSYLLKWLGLLGHLLLRIVNPLFTPLRRALDWLLEVYPVFLRRVLQQRTLTMGIALVLLIAALAIFPRLGRELIPELHQGEFYLDCVLPVGTALEKTTAVVIPLAERLQELPQVEQVSAQIGSETTSANNPEAGEHYGRLTVRLGADQDFITAEQPVIAAIRQQVMSIPDLNVRVRYPTLFSFTTPIQVVLQGYNLDTLRQLSGQVAAELEAISGLTDINTTLQSGFPEVQVVYDRDRLAYHNLNLYDVASLVRDKVLGKVSTRFRDREERIDIRVMVDEADRKNVSQLAQLVINPGGEQQLALRDVAQLNIVEGPSEIRRLDRQRSAVITANLSGISLSAASDAINSQLQKIQLPFGFRASLQGQSEEMQRSLNSLLFALLLAVFLVYLVMASQFESLSHPFIIIFAVPLAFIGVALLLLIMNIPVSVVVFLGAIMLVGIVVNNAIVLVDYINLLRSRGIEKMEAIVQAAQVRIRPILMTTLTTVLGLLPLAIGWGDGAEMRAPMALTVIGGLLSSTLLTLVVVPVLYSIFDIRKRDA